LVVDRLDLGKTASANAAEATFEIIKKTHEGGEALLISAFGKFCVKDKGERRGRNPGTREEVILTKGRVVTFKCAQVLKRWLNGGEQ
jgi:integration host factor subunit alpha